MQVKKHTIIFQFNKQQKKGFIIFFVAILCRTIHLIDRILLLNDQMTKLDLQLRAVK